MLISSDFFETLAMACKEGKQRRLFALGVIFQKSDGLGYIVFFCLKKIIRAEGQGLSCLKLHKIMVLPVL